MLIVSRLLLDILTLRNRRVAAMALWPFIIFAEKRYRDNPVMFNHEKIHHRQQLELLIIPYYIWYFIEYWSAMFSNGFKHHQSYLSVSFEQEAFAREKDLTYLKNRKWLASLPFFLARFGKNR